MRSTEQGRPTRRAARDLALLIALTLGIHAPFIHQAFHIDDVYYLDVASNVFRNPLFPLDLQSVFEGKHLTLWAHSHPPLNSYVIAGLLLLNNRGDNWNGRMVTTKWTSASFQPVAWWSKTDLSRPINQPTDRDGRAQFYAPPRGYDSRLSFIMS